MKVRCLLLIGATFFTVHGQRPSDDLLLKAYVAETDQAAKERLLTEIVRRPDAGPTLLRVAVSATIRSQSSSKNARSSRSSGVCVAAGAGCRAAIRRETAAFPAVRWRSKMPRAGGDGAGASPVSSSRGRSLSIARRWGTA